MSWLYISFVIYVVVLAVALGLFFLDVRLKDRRKQARQLGSVISMPVVSRSAPEIASHNHRSEVVRHSPPTCLG